MKKILITGKHSYIGTSLENWLMREPDKYKVNTVDMKDGSWKEMDFSPFDVVFHVAGIAHIKETKENRSLYYKVNKDLAYEAAQKAKKDGVEQFIFLSSMSVYGINNGVIDKGTPVNPINTYGKAKIEAEEMINKLQTDSFSVVTLRPPMVYGKGCKGNYPRLVGVALKTPIFPKVNNKRSMIYIDNLSIYVKILIDERRSGLFFPQNAKYVNTSDMVRLIAEANGKNIRLTKLFNYIIAKLDLNILNKIFGDLVYSYDLQEPYFDSTNLISFEESITRIYNNRR